MASLTPTNSCKIAALLAGPDGRSILTHEAINVDDCGAVDRTVERTLQSLERWSDRHEGHHNEWRSYERVSFRGRPIIVVEHDIPIEEGEEPQESVICFEAWGRDVSSGGMSFLCPERLLPNSGIDDNVDLTHIDRIIDVDCELVVGIEQASGDWIWLSSRVLRLRKVHNGLFEIGLKFSGRVE